MTLICLISGQLAPNLLSILHFKPDEVVLVCSPDTEKNAERFKGLLEKKYQIEQVHIQLSDPFHPQKIREAAEKTAERFKAKKIVLNYTGGTKPMSVGFYTVFSKKEQADILYVDTQQECFWLTQNRKVSEIPFDFSFELDTLFDLQEINVKEQAEEVVTDQLTDLTLLCFKGKISRRKTAIIRLMKSAVDARIKEKPWNPSCQTDTLEVRVLDKNTLSVRWGRGNTLEQTKEFWLDYFSGGWFEYWCFTVLKKSRWFDDIRCNIKINPNSRAREEVVKNEIDVLAIRNGVPVFVECKTGIVDQKSITNLKAVMDHYGSTYSQGILVSLWPLPSKHDVLKEKLTDYNIALVEGPKNIENKLIETCNEMVVKV